MELADHLGQGFGGFPVEHMSAVFDPNIPSVRNIAPKPFRMPGGCGLVFTTAYDDGG